MEREEISDQFQDEGKSFYERDYIMIDSTVESWIDTPGSFAVLHFKKGWSFDYCTSQQAVLSQIFCITFLNTKDLIFKIYELLKLNTFLLKEEREVL